MITDQQVRQLIDEKLAGTDCFLVQLKVNAGNKILVLMDSDSGLTIDQLVEWNRYLAKSLDRDKEDFELTVSSPGVGEPLLVNRQYKKNIGRTVSVKTLEGKKWEGVLGKADDQTIEISYREKERIDGRKAKRWVDKTQIINLADVKETKVQISFN